MVLIWAIQVNTVISLIPSYLSVLVLFQKERIFSSRRDMLLFFFFFSWEEKKQPPEISEQSSGCWELASPASPLGALPYTVPWHQHVRFYLVNERQRCKRREEVEGKIGPKKKMEGSSGNSVYSLFWAAAFLRGGSIMPKNLVAFSRAAL